MKKVLVTGGAGAIGNRLVKKLCEEFSVYIIDDFSSGWMQNLDGLSIEKLWKGSILDDDILNEAFNFSPEIVFHLAANFANQSSVQYPQKDLQINSFGTLKLLQYSLKYNIKKFIYTSSSCVCGAINSPLYEHMVGEKLDTPYAISKLAGERYVEFFNEYHKLPTVILRIFNSYGPGEFPGKFRNVIPNFLQSILLQKPLIVTGTGEETRDFTFVDDIVYYIISSAFLEEAVGQKINIANGLETSINELIKLISRTCGISPYVFYHPRRAWDSILRRRADVSKMKRIFRLANPYQTTSLENGLQQTYKWFLDNQNYIKSISK